MAGTKEIRELVLNIRRELREAEHYAVLALESKTPEPELASLFYSLATKELRHADAQQKMALHLMADVDMDAVPVELIAAWDLQQELILWQQSKIAAALEVYNQ